MNIVGEQVSGAAGMARALEGRGAEQRASQGTDNTSRDVLSREVSLDVVYVKEANLEMVFASVAERVVLQRTQVDAVSGGLSLSGLSERFLGYFNQFMGRSDEGGRLAGIADSFLNAVDEGFTEASKAVVSGVQKNEEFEKAAQVQYERVQTGVSQAVSSRAFAEESVERNQSDSEGRLEKADGAVPARGRFEIGRFESYELGRSFDFSLQTADGDVVNIQVADLLVAQRSAGIGVGGNGVAAFLSESFSYESGFALQVEGELDDAELGAIRDLLAQVAEISEAFFGGDFQGAFEEALNIGFDTAEISAFSLDLMRAERAQVGAYADAGPSGAASRYMPLAKMAESVIDLQARASMVSSAGSDLLALLENRLLGVEEKTESASKPVPEFMSFVGEVMARIS